MLEDPFDDFFAEMPALSASPVQQQEAKQEKKDDLVGQEDPRAALPICAR